MADKIAKPSPKKLREIEQKLTMQRSELLDLIQANNRDLIDRVSRLVITLEYDAEEDILFEYFGERRPAITQHFREGLHLRLDEDYRIIGLEVLDFSKRFRESALIRDIYGDRYSAILHDKTIILPPSSNGSKTVARQLGQAKGFSAIVG